MGVNPDTQITGGLLDFKGNNFSADDAKSLAQSGKLVVTERQRPGEYFPVFEGDNFTAMPAVCVFVYIYI